MLIHEPMTLLTDYAIAGESCGFVILLLQGGKLQPAVRLWVLAFGWVAIAAALGGTYHGFGPDLSLPHQMMLWQWMLLALAGASLCMLAASLIATLPPRLHRWALWIALVKTLLYLGWATLIRDFGWIVGDYLSAMVLVLVLHLRWVDRDQKAASWIVAGVVVSGLAVAIVGSRVTIAPYFNHNDLYHLVQMVGLYGFYRGVSLLKQQEFSRT